MQLHKNGVNWLLTPTGIQIGCRTIYWKGELYFKLKLMIKIATTEWENPELGDGDSA